MENISQFKELLKRADVAVNGARPWDPQIKDERVYDRVLREGSLGLGESYVDGSWDCKDLAELTCRIMRSDVYPLIREISLSLPRTAGEGLAPVHYDAGNEFFETMLGPTMAYTCGYWRDVKGLDDAQRKKWDLVCRKIGLHAGQTLLDIGCGWGGFARHAAWYYGAMVVGVTNSKEQAAFAEERYRNTTVEVRLQDYCDVKGMYDHVVSLGMFEHIGAANYRTYFDIVRRCLKDDGLFLLHTITGSVSTDRYDPWMEKYIFPGAQLPSLAQITEASEGLFVMEDAHNFGADYDRTLREWYRNLELEWYVVSPKSAPDVRTRRTWEYYLLTSASTFRARRNHVCQFVLSPSGVPRGYESIR